MPPVYVTRQGARLNIENRRLRVSYADEELVAVPLGQLTEVVLFGNIGLTTPAIDACLAGEIEVIFLTADGDYRGRLAGMPTPHVPLRRAQYARADDPAFVLAMAQGFVQAKLAHERALLLRHNRDRQDPQIAAAAEQIGAGIASAGRKTTLPALRGAEGAATAAYFGGLRRLLGAAWRFERRARRPPPDPINAMLSLAYTLLGEAAAGAVQAVGLDPYLGFLHDVAYGRPALGLDLLEEFRPVADGVVLWCCNSGQVTPDDFSPGPAARPVVLSDAGRRRFLTAYETRMEQAFTHPLRGLRYPLRGCLVEQARQIADRIRAGDAGYTGMGFR